MLTDRQTHGQNRKTARPGSRREKKKEKKEEEEEEERKEKGENTRPTFFGRAISRRKVASVVGVRSGATPVQPNKIKGKRERK